MTKRKPGQASPTPSVATPGGVAETSLCERLLGLRAATAREACEQLLVAMSAPCLGTNGWKVSELDGQAVAAVYAAGADLAERLGEAECEVASLRADAVFIMGRTSMRDAMVAREQRRRSTAGATGGRPRAIDDAKVIEANEQFKRTHAKTGQVKFVAGRLGVDPKTASAALKRLNLRA